MEETPIEQLWYTWSPASIDDVGPGLNMRAASPGLTGIRKRLSQFIQHYASYRLPNDFDPDTMQAPECLALLDTPFGKCLLHKVYIGKDAFGRSGNFFTHLLLNLPENFTARDAIHFWKSPFWKDHDIPEREQSTELPSLTLSDLSRFHAQQNFNFAQAHDQLRSLIKAFLAPTRQQQRLTITGTSEQVALFIWGLAHSLPEKLLPPTFTFTTYEYESETSQATITGITETSTVSSPNQKDALLNYIPEPQTYSDAKLEAAIATFAQFAVDCLSQTPGGHSTHLDSFIERAEKEEIADVNRFMTFFMVYFRKGRFTQLLRSLQIALKRGDWPRTLQVCNEISEFFPPAANPNVWHSLFQSLSKEPFRQQIIEHPGTHQWLIGNLAAASPEAIKELNHWLSDSWDDLEAFLALRLPEDWFIVAIENTLLSLQRTSPVPVELFEQHEAWFTRGLQKFATQSGKDYEEALITFYAALPDSSRRKRLLALLLNTEGIVPETRYQLVALEQVESPKPLKIPRTAEPSSEPPAPPRRAARIVTTQQSVQRVSIPVPVQHTNKRERPLLILVIGILLLTNILLLITRPDVSALQITIARQQFTIALLQTRVALLSPSATTPATGDEGSIVDHFVTSTVQQNTQGQTVNDLTVYVNFKNTRQTTWSKAGDYNFACIVNGMPDPRTDNNHDCFYPGYVDFSENEVPPGHFYGLSLTFHNPTSGHSVTLGLFKGNNLVHGQTTLTVKFP